MIIRRTEINITITPLKKTGEFPATSLEAVQVYILHKIDYHVLADSIPYD
jgi:hypothetical protein